MIGLMTSSGNDRRSAGHDRRSMDRTHVLKTSWFALLALAMATFAVGCGAEPGDSSEKEVTARSVSELETAPSVSQDGKSDGSDGDGKDVPGATILNPSGKTAPLDPRAEPDPIPWHRTASGAHASDT